MPHPAPQNPSIVLRGRLLTDPARTPEPGWVRILGDRIDRIGFGDPPPASTNDLALGSADAVICPGFVDAHIHLPQIDSAGCDGMELLPWLQSVVFPAEGWWGRGQALSMARTAVRRMLTHGTMGFAGYLTSHGEINTRVLDFLQTRSPLRCIVGRAAMDRAAPDDLLAEDRARASMQPMPSPVLPMPNGDLAPGRHRASANPRFAISCTDELLAEIGWFVRDHPGTWVQTHLSESIPEVRRIAELFPADPNYTSVYDRFGLLTDRSLMAHSIHLSEAEWALMAARNAIAVHCPTANIFLRAGLFPRDTAIDAGVRIALGSDVAGGPDVAMPRVARAMIETAKVRALATGAAVRIPTPAEAWTLITRGNADILGWTDTCRLEAGAAADLLILRPPTAWLDDHCAGRLLYNWSEALIDTRIVAGRIADPTTI
jgi:guanine deaminase